MATFKVQDGTPIRWAEPTASPTPDNNLSLNALATVVGRQGVKQDLGATRAEIFGFRFKTDFTTNPTAGDLVRLFIGFSEDNTNFAGELTGTDAAFSDTDIMKHLSELRPLVVDASTAAQQVVGKFRATARYCAPVVFNATGIAFVTGDDEHEFVIWPIEGVSA